MISEVILSSINTCVNWLDEYETYRKQFIDDFSNIPAISYEEKIGGKAKDYSREAYIADTIADFDKRYDPIVKYCKLTLEIANTMLEEVSEPNIDVVQLRYLHGITQEEIAEQLFMSRSNVIRRLEQENRNLSKLDNCSI